MKRIAVASIQQETCHFNPVKMTMKDFTESYFKVGDEVAQLPANEWELGGFLAAMRPRNPDLVGILSARTGAGGPLSAEVLPALEALLYSGLAKAGPVDAVFLALHGAIAAENEPDVTGAIITGVRQRVGRSCFIAVLLDHHCNITSRMVEQADVMLAYETQPHNFPASGAKAARVMLDIWENKRTPYGALVKIPLITPQDQFLTASGPMKDWFDLARNIEKEPGIIVTSTCPTQPWLDVPDNGWSTLVYADSPEKARSSAQKLAQKAWDLRARFWESGRLSVADTVAAANAEPKGLVVISDTGDSMWGGSPGDSTALMTEMLKQGLQGPALVPIVDPEAFARASQARLGETLTLRVGGKLSSWVSPSLEVTGTVAAKAEAGERAFGDGLTANAGPSVLFEVGLLKIVLLNLRDFVVNHPVMYEKLGVDVSKAKMVVLKTASNFQYFRKYQSRLIRADSPGATQSDLTKLDWRHITRPIYPFDDIQGWKAGQGHS